jgi:putative peptidoglycan lipid II flippase
LEYADRARVIPQTLLESTLLMVAFATWSNLRAAGRPDEARAAVDQALRWTLALSAPIVAGMFIGRIALVRLLYERGAFTPEDTLATAEALAFYLPGVVPNLLGILALRAHIVERNLHLVLRLGLLSVIANCVLNALLVGPLGLPGLALATTIVMVLIPGLYLRLLWKTLPRDPGRWRPVWGLLAATLVVVALAEQLGPPEDIGDLRLWAWSLPCLLLLGLGWRLTQGRPAA